MVVGTVCVKSELKSINVIGDNHGQEKREEEKQEEESSAEAGWVPCRAQAQDETQGV